MPFIHIKSLPLEKPFDVGAVLVGVSRDLSETAAIDIQHITATWLFLPSSHYAVAGSVVPQQVKSAHPIIVDLLAPDLHAPYAIEKILADIASSIARRSGMPITNIFISYRAAQTGMVFDAGELVRW